MIPVMIYWSAIKKLVVIPNMAQTEPGFWMDVAPVHVAKLRDKDLIASAIKSVSLAPLKTVPTPPRSSFPRPVVLKAGKVRSWSQFHWAYSLVAIDPDENETFSVSTWEKHSDGSDQPSPEVPARITLTLEEAINVVIEAIQAPE